MKNGYIYVLANSSMPGLVKVGMTSRPPDDRAQELSGATGVPTQFIVVYEQYVADCSAAESFVHTTLERKGFRVSENREFFSAPVKEVVNAILSIPTDIVTTGRVEEEDDLISPSVVDELSALALIENSDSYDYPPWWSIWQQAEAAYYGLEDEIEDHREALRLYRDSAKLGCHLAYERLAQLHSGTSQVVGENVSKAIDYLKEGARRGNYACYLNMASIFNYNEQTENSKKCLKFFFRDRENKKDELVEREMFIDQSFIEAISGPINIVSSISEQELVQVIEMRDDLLLVVQKKLDRYRTQDWAQPLLPKLEEIHEWLYTL